MILFLYSCFSSFWAFCSGYLMFIAIFLFFFFNIRGRAYFRLLRLLRLITPYLFRGLLPLVLVPSVPRPFDNSSRRGSLLGVD